MVIRAMTKTATLVAVLKVERWFAEKFHLVATQLKRNLKLVMTSRGAKKKKPKGSTKKKKKRREGRGKSMRNKKERYKKSDG